MMKNCLLALFKWPLRAFLFCLLFNGCRTEFAGDEINSMVTIVPVDPLEKIFRETAFFNAVDPTANVARGEEATFQVVIRSRYPISSLTADVDTLMSDVHAITNVHVGYVGFVHVGRSEPNPSSDRLNVSSGWYPDPILEKESIDLPANDAQPIWVSVQVPVDAIPGIYSGLLRINGILREKTFEYTLPVHIHVYPVTVDKSSLWVSNWYTTSPQTIGELFGKKSVKPYSGDYWRYIHLLADKMAEYRQNVALISPLQLAKYSIDATGKLAIDFSNFDKTVDIFRKAGVSGRIEGGHLAVRAGDWNSDFVLRVPSLHGDSTVFRNLPLNNDSTRHFYSVFIPELLQHLKSKGWDSIYLQHVADEPIDQNAASYTAIARYIKHLAPGLKIIDACHSTKLDGSVQVWVPQLDYLDKDYDFYKARQKSGDEVWYYTCLDPKGEYANRFIDLPLIKARLLPWIDYRYGITGYLHWGFDFWNDDPYAETTGIQTDSGTILPGGDSWIVYPGNHRLISSIRLEAMRDGIADYALLEMLNRKKPGSADSIARQVVFGFDRYDTNIPAFRQKRKAILQLLSEK